MEKTNWLLDTEEDILKKVPAFTKDQVKVMFRAIGLIMAVADRSAGSRGGKVSSVVMGAGLLQPRPSTRSDISSRIRVSILDLESMQQSFRNFRFGCSSVID